jgi:hypothetical protein
MMRATDLPVQLWIEMHDPIEQDACDVIVKMESGQYYTAIFVTLPFLARQMDLGYEMCKEMRYASPVRYATLETPHILVAQCNRETIEDTIDNLLSLDIFENLFTQVTEDDDLPDTSNGKRTTTELAAVVVSEVLLTEDADLELATTVA